MDAPALHVFLDDKGTPRTINRHVKVSMIVQKHLVGGQPLEDVAEHYEISVADVYAALAYYHDNKAAMDAETTHKEALTHEVGVSGATLRSKIEQRMKDLRGE